MTVSSALQVWSSTTGHEVAALLSASPLNCVTFVPEGHLLAAGCWNGNVIVWNWLQNKTQTVSNSEEREFNRSAKLNHSSPLLKLLFKLYSFDCLVY